MKYPKLDWMVIEAHDNDDKFLEKNYWDLVKMEREKRSKELAGDMRRVDNEFRKFLIESGVIDNTLKHLFGKHRTPDKVKKAIRQNGLDRLAKFYDLQKQFNEAYTKYKRFSK
jgi:hypothetical protein